MEEIGGGKRAENRVWKEKESSEWPRKESNRRVLARLWQQEVAGAVSCSSNFCQSSDGIPQGQLESQHF
jgi:hypothetical protein